MRILGVIAIIALQVGCGSSEGPINELQNLSGPVEYTLEVPTLEEENQTTQTVEETTTAVSSSSSSSSGGSSSGIEEIVSLVLGESPLGSDIENDTLTKSLKVSLLIQAFMNIETYAKKVKEQVESAVSGLEGQARQDALDEEPGVTKEYRLLASSISLANLLIDDLFDTQTKQDVLVDFADNLFFTHFKVAQVLDMDIIIKGDYDSDGYANFEDTCIFNDLVYDSDDC